MHASLQLCLSWNQNLWHHFSKTLRTDYTILFANSFGIRSSLLWKFRFLVLRSVLKTAVLFIQVEVSGFFRFLVWTFVEVLNHCCKGVCLSILGWETSTKAKKWKRQGCICLSKFSYFFVFLICLGMFSKVPFTGRTVSFGISQ